MQLIASSKRRYELALREFSKRTFNFTCVEETFHFSTPKKFLSNFQDNGESNSEAAPLSPDPAEDELPSSAATSSCYTQTTPEDRGKIQQQGHYSIGKYLQ